jgi:hypothetical protein
MSMYSGRTAKYVEAMIQEGDRFNYYEWLNRVRREEAHLASTRPPPQDPVCSTKSGPPERPAKPVTCDRGAKAPRLTTNVPFHQGRAPRAAPPLRNDGISQKSIRQRLGDVRNAWDSFQEDRARDGIYRYLGAVFWIVKDWSGRSRTRKLVRRAYKFAGVLPVDMNADPFAVVVRCTCEHAVDNKTISKWSRALRFAAKFKKPRVRLKSFMKDRGGINGCASLWAKHLRSGK